MGNELRPPSIIRVTAGARLHIQVIDPAGESGFRRGGVGIALSKPCTSVILSSELNHINYQRNDPLKDEILKEMSILGIKTEYDFFIHVRCEIPAHVGLGSETVTRTAARIAVLALLGIPVREEIYSFFSLASLTGVGLYTVLEGGLAVTGGLPLDTPMPEQVLTNEFSTRAIPGLIASLKMPPTWVALLCIPHQYCAVGPSGIEEKKFYSTLPAPNSNELHNCSHQILAKLLPAVRLGNYNAFVEAMKVVTGANWKPFEQRVNSMYWDQISSVLLMEGVPFVAVTSSGPTCYTILDSKDIDANDLVQHIAYRTKNICSVILSGIATEGFAIIPESQYEKRNDHV